MPNKKKTSKSSLKKRVKPVKSTVKKPAKTKKAKAAPSKKIRARVSQGQLPKRPADSNAAATDKSKKSSAGKSGADRKDGSAGKSGKPVVIHNAPTVSVSSKGGSVGDFDFSSRTKSTSKIKEWSGPNGLDYSVPEEPSRKAGRRSRADDDDGADYPVGMAHPPAHYTLNFEPHIKPEFHANSYGTYNAKGSHVSKSSKTTKPTRVIVNKPAIRKYKPPEFKENKVGKSVLNFISPEQRQPVSVDIAPEPPLAPPAPKPRPVLSDSGTSSISIPPKPRPVLSDSGTSSISIPRKRRPKLTDVSGPLYYVPGVTRVTQDNSNESKEELDDLPSITYNVKKEPEDNNMVVEYNPEVQVASGLLADLGGLTGRFEAVPSRKQLSRLGAKPVKKKVKAKKLLIQSPPGRVVDPEPENPGDQSLAQALVPSVPLPQPMETNAALFPVQNTHWARTHSERIVGNLKLDDVYMANTENINEADYDWKTADKIRSLGLNPSKRQVLEIK